MKIVKTKKQTDKGTLYKRTCAYCGKTVEFYHAEKPSHCPFCGAFNYIKPKTETKLFLLQKEYFDSGRNNDVLGKMYIILVEYAKSMVKTEIKNNDMTRYTFDDVDMKAADAASYLLEYYMTKPSFKIEQSFGGYLSNKVQQALYNKKDQKEEKDISSYNAIFHDSEGHEGELGDFEKQLGLTYIFGDESEYRKRIQNEKELFHGIQKIVGKSALTVKENYDTRDSLLLLIGVYIRLREHSNKIMDKYYRHFGSEYKDFIDKTLLILYEFIKESQLYQQKEY